MRSKMAIHPLRAAIALALAPFLLTACSSDSDDDEQPSPNIAQTQIALDQATQVWNQSNIQNYVFRQSGAGFCTPESGIVVDPAPPMLNVVTDSGEVFGILAGFSGEDEDFSYRVSGITYNNILTGLNAVLADQPVELFGTTRQVPPSFDERGLVVNWFHRFAGEQCGSHVAVQNFSEMSDLDFDLITTFERLEAGRATWFAQGLSDYTVEARFVYGSCEAPQVSSLATMRFVDGVLDETEWDGEDTVMPAGESLPDFTFARLAWALSFGAQDIRVGLDTSDGGDATIEFDPNFGYPASYVVIPQMRSNCEASGMLIEAFY